MQNWDKQQSTSCRVKWNTRSEPQLLILIQNAFWGKSLLSGTSGNPHLNTTGMCSSLSGIHTSASVKNAFAWRETEKSGGWQTSYFILHLFWKQVWDERAGLKSVIHIKNINKMSPKAAGATLCFHRLSLTLLCILSCNLTLVILWRLTNSHADFQLMLFEEVYIFHHHIQIQQDPPDHISESEQKQAVRDSKHRGNSCFHPSDGRNIWAGHKTFWPQHPLIK